MRTGDRFVLLNKREKERRRETTGMSAHARMLPLCGCSGAGGNDTGGNVATCCVLLVLALDDIVGDDTLIAYKLTCFIFSARSCESLRQRRCRAGWVSFWVSFRLAVALHRPITAAYR